MPTIQSVAAILTAASGSSTSSKTSAAGSLGSLFFIVLLGVLAYVFFIRPRSQQARRQRDTLQQLNVGDEVLTGAGIFGRVLDVETDRVTIEAAPGTRLTVLRSTIARRITEHPEEEEGWDEGNSAEHEGPPSSIGWNPDDGAGNGSARESDAQAESGEAEQDLDEGRDAAAGGEAGR
jgi:preprotein translocase subunit YajC